MSKLKSSKALLQQISVPQTYQELFEHSKNKEWAKSLKALEKIIADTSEQSKTKPLSKVLVGQFIAPKSYLEGNEHYKQKQWSKAIEKLSQAIAEQPNHADSHFKLGMCYMKISDFEQAHHHITHAIKINPHKTQWQTQLQQCEKQLQNNNQTEPVGTPNPTPHSPAMPPRIREKWQNTTSTPSIRRKVLIVPSDYNHRALADILPFVPLYSKQFDVYIIVRELPENIVYESNHTLVKNGTSFGEYLKFTADFVIDAGTLNYGYRISETATWTSVWHGIPYKKMFVDLDEKHLATAIRYGLAYDNMISMSDYYTETFLRNSMRYDGPVLQLGSAKTDKLFVKNNQETRKDLYKDLQITTDKVVLYAPCERNTKTIKLNFDASLLLEQLGDDYTLVILTPKKNEFEEGQIIQHPRIVQAHNLTELQSLVLADIFISDYHPLTHLFHKYHKPVVLFQYDYEIFLSQHQGRRQEIEKLTDNSLSVTRAYHFNKIDWAKLVRKAQQTPILPENIFEKTLKDKLGIPEGKKVILYAPTFRQAGKTTLPFDPDKLIQSTKNSHVIVTKLHYLNKLETSSKNVIDCTEYGEITELMRIADVLISDYSSLILDFALLNKPIVLFQYDYFDYVNQRGVYFDFEDYLPMSQIIDRENDLYKINWKNLKKNNQALIDKFYPLEDGNSAKRIVEALNFDSTPRQTKDIIFLVNDLHQIGGVHAFAHNMAKYFKTKYNTKIHLLAIKEFATANSELHFFDSPYFDTKISSQYLNGACSNILQNTDGYVISLQFSAHMHFQRHLYGAKTILMFHGDVKDMVSGDLYGPHLGWLNNQELYNFDKFLLLTKTNMDLINQHLSPELIMKTGFIHNSIDANFTRLPPATHQNHIAVISRLDVDKNIFALIDIGLQIKSSNQDFVINIYGDGELRGEFEAKIAEHQLQDHLVLHGFEADKEKIFTQNAALLLPSKSEGMPLVVLEAYSYARPVIAFDSFTATREIIIHGKTGFLAPYGDFAEIVKYMNDLPSIQTDTIEKHYQHFNNETIFAQWQELFDKLDSN